MSTEKIKKIRLAGKFNSSALMIVTPEYFKLRKIRKLNEYPKKPTFEKPAEMPFERVEISGLNIRYAHAENKGKPTLVMLSPFPQSIMGYAPIWGELSKKFNLYAFDMPGFGRSEGGKKHMTFKFQGEFLRDFIKHFKIKDAHLLGPDVGMPAVLYYTGTFKNTVKTILIGDGPAIDPSSNASAVRKMVKSSFWRLVFKLTGSGAMIAGANRICYTNYRPNEDEISDYLYSYRRRIPAAMKWFKDYPDSLATVDPLIEKIKVPTKIFWGDQDAILYADNGQRISERMTNADLTIYKDTGHFVYQDRYKEFQKMVITWIGKNK